MQNYLIELQKGFNQNTRNISRFVEELSEKESLFRPYDKVNHIVWNLGHITFVRNTIIKLLDPNPSIELFENERDLFMPGKELMPNEAYPPLTLILEHFIKRGDKIIQLLTEVSEEQLHKESWLKIGSEPRSNENILFYFYNHETEHLGEIKLLRNLTTRLRKLPRKKNQI
jgi:uncharacterized damage-inducible protein DinB